MHSNKTYFSLKSYVHKNSEQSGIFHLDSQIL